MRRPLRHPPHVFLQVESMLVSWNWLREYVSLDVPVETLTQRLMMTGLNLESVAPANDDFAVDLEVTSNRPDCLGHIGVAREASVLFHRPLNIPAARPVEQGPAIASLTSVEIAAPDLCPQYQARLIRGVKIGPSPAWMQQRLTTLGLRPVNNVVDITNYVLLECGQPLHAFDFDKLRGRRIVVRRAAPGEKLFAIDQREYALAPEMCVIADAERPVAIAGVMGGLETEIGPATQNVLIEVAEFTPMSVRDTARRLNLHSDSSYRFERGVDRRNLDWASRRCAELILELAGGELCAGHVFAGVAPPPRGEPIVLRFAQICRLLGIDISPNEAVRILESLGLHQVSAAVDGVCRFVPPSWRRDLTREIDLIEEIARVHGYELIPEDVLVPLEVGARTLRDRVTDRAQEVLLAAGFSEAITLSFVGEELHGLFRPWTAAPPLRVEHSSRQRENLLRQSLVPSLLAVRRQNERHGCFNARLFEQARVYLAADPGAPGSERLLLSFVSGLDFARMKGLAEAVADAVNHAARVTARPAALPGFAPGRGCELLLDGAPWGWLGEIDAEIARRLDLQESATVAEIDMEMLESRSVAAPSFQPLPQFPAVERDLNFILDETVVWHSLAETVHAAAGPLLESVTFDSQYRGPQIAPHKKSYLLRLQYRASDRTLTAEEVESAQQAVITACRTHLAATLR